MQLLKSSDPRGVDPGSYIVETASGSTYLISVPEPQSGESATAVRVPQQPLGEDIDEPFFVSTTLYKDSDTIELIKFHFEVGRSGAMTFRDEAARNAPGYVRGDGEYEVTIRQTTLVTRIRRVEFDTASPELAPE